MSNLVPSIYNELNVKDFEVVGDGITDDTTAIQAAIDAAQDQRRTLVFPRNYTYRITSTITIKASGSKTHHIVFEGAKENISTSEKTGSIIYDGGNNDIAVYVEHQGPGPYTVIEGLSVINDDPATDNNCIGILFHDTGGTSTGSFRIKAYNLAVTNFETGFRWGNEEGDTRIGSADAFGHTNIDDNLYQGLKTYRCGRPFIYDCSGGDHNTFSHMLFEGDYDDIAYAGAGTYTCEQKMWIRRAGTGNLYSNAFINLSDVSQTGAGVNIDDGDGLFEVFNFESADIGCQMLNVATSATRAGLTFKNWGCPSNINAHSGSHTAAASSATVLTDSAASFGATDALVGYYLKNTTDKSHGRITASTGTTATVAALTGGTDNDWDQNDTYIITSAPPSRDLDDVCAYISAPHTVTLENCSFDGNVQCQSHVISSGSMFTDDGDGTIFGLVETFATKPVAELFSRSRQGTGATPTSAVKNRLVNEIYYNANYSIDYVYNYTGNLSDNVFEDIVDIAVPNDTAIGAKLSYFLFGPSVTNTQRLAERGEFFITCVTDDTGNMAADITKGSFSQSLDGFTTLTVTGQTTTVPASDKVTIAIRQDNNVNNNAIRGIFRLELSHCDKGVASTMDPTNVTWLEF
jgi:hypothetical protein